MIIPEYEQIKHHATEKYCENNFPEFHKYINEKYINFNISFKEKLYWYYNGLTCYPTCKICGNRVNFHRFCDGYYSTCSSRCANIISRQKAKQTCLKRYGDENYRNMDKAKQTFLEKYGVKSYTQTKEYWEKHNKTCIDKYGVENPLTLEEIKTKIINSKRKNKSFNSSKIEEKFANYLTTNKIRFKRQYKSSIYPFNCDFYFPDNDLYLEINAHWTHGGHPFDSTDKEDLIKLEQWRKQNTDFYNHAIKTWTVRDVLKRETAKKNNLNYLEMFTNKIDDAIIMFESKIKNI